MQPTNQTRQRHVLPILLILLAQALGASLASAQPQGCKPNPPSGVALAPGCNSIQLSWSGVPFALDYDVWRATSPDFNTANRIAARVGNVYQDTTAAPGVTYCYWVRSNGGPGCGQSGNSPVVCGKRKEKPTAAPSVSATDGTSCQSVFVAWNSVPHATEYEVYRSTSAGSNGSRIATTGTTSYEDKNASAGRNYYYRVRGKSTCGQGPFSSPELGWRESKPSRPSGLTASDGTDCSNVLVDWNPVSGASSYLLYRNTSNNSGTAQLISSNAIRPYVDSVPTTQVFFYWVVASNGVCTSDFSTSNSGYRNSAPATPTGLSATSGPGCGEVRLGWSSAARASSYQLLRNTTNNSSGAAVVGTAAGTSYVDFPGPGTFYYWVKGTNACGTSGPSTGRSIAATEQPVITAQPSSQSVCPGVTVQFSVSATGGGLQYAWRHNGVPLGVGGSTLAIVASAAGAGTYDVVVSNSCGSVTSSQAVLTVGVAPTIQQDPADLAVCEGQPAAFSVLANGPGPLLYQWRRNGTPIAGASASSLQLTNVAQANAGAYDVEVTASTGCVTISRTASLTVDVQPVILSSTPAQTVCEGTPATFMVSASGGSLSYQWRKNGAPLSGMNAPVLVIPSSTAGDAGTYTCLVQNGCGAATSVPSVLTVDESAKVLQSPQSVSPCEGNDVTLQVVAGGKAPLSYQWYKDGAPVQGAQSPVLALLQVSQSEAGSYVCDVTNLCGTTTSAAAFVNVIPGEPSLWRSLGGSFSRDVLALTHFDDGSGEALYAGGDFTSVAGQPIDRLARWDGISWSEVGGGLDGEVHALAVHDDGNGPALYAGGNFGNAGGVSVDGVARWDGSAWTDLGGGVNGTVLALASFDDGSGSALYVGGSFRQSGGGGARDVARWRNGSWEALNASRGAVHAFAIHDDGAGPALFAGGDFSSGIARLSGADLIDVGDGNTQKTRCLASYDSGAGAELYAGGEFRNALSRIAVLRAGQWSSVAGGMNAPVNALEVVLEKKKLVLYAAGDFTQAGGSQADRIARYDGSSWQSAGQGVDGEVFTLEGDGGGFDVRLFVGGAFRNSNAKPLDRLGVWEPRERSLALSQPAGSGSLLVTNACGPAGSPYATFFSFEPLNLTDPGGGNWYGLHVPLSFVRFQLGFAAPPFRGVLDADGSSSFLFPQGSLRAFRGLPVYATTLTLGASFQVTGVAPVTGLVIQ